MNRLKRNICLMLVVLLLGVMAACSSDDGASSDGAVNEEVTYEWSVGFNTVEDSIRERRHKNLRKC